MAGDDYPGKETIRGQNTVRVPCLEADNTTSDTYSRDNRAIVRVGLERVRIRYIHACSSTSGMECGPRRSSQEYTDTFRLRFRN